MKVFFALTAFLLASTAFAQAGGCLDKNRVAEIYREFNITSTAGDPKTRFDLCDRNGLGYSILDAILFLKDVGTLDVTRNEFNPNILNARPFDFFKAKVRAIVFEERLAADDCPGLAHVLPGEESRGIMHICVSAAAFDPMVLSAVLVHEARHLDGSQYVHETCASGSHRGQFSCDHSFQNGGSYAINTEYEVGLSQTRRFDPVLRAEARSQAVVDFLTRFNIRPFDLRDGALLGDANGALSFFDGQTVQDTGLRIRPGGVMALLAGLPTLFDPADGSVKAFVFQSQLVTARWDVLSKRYRLTLTPAERRAVIDVVYGKAYVCFLTESSIECGGKDENFFKKSISGFKAKRFIYEEGRSSFIPAGVVHIVSTDGRIFALPESLTDLRASPSTDWPQKSARFEAISAHSWWGGDILLRPDGKVSLYTRRDKKWTAPAALSGKAYNSLHAPFTWSQKLNSL